MLDSLCLQILNLSFTASYVILGVLMVRLFLKKAPKIFSYALWSVVLFRLVCPVSFESPLSWFSLTGRTMAQLRPFPQTFDTVSNTLPGAETSLNSGVPATEAAGLPLLSGIFTLVWLIGMGVLLLYSGLTLIKLQKRLHCAVREKDHIYTAAGLESPFVMGVFRPKIYLPAGLRPEEKEYILLHEQTHIKRFDQGIKLLSFGVLCLHWFNPLVWVAFFCSGRDMEMSCDERVIRCLGNGVKKEYSTSLLTFATGRRSIGSTPLAFGEGDTKSRIQNVLNYKKPAFWVILLAVVGVVVVSFGLLTNPQQEKQSGAWAADIYRCRTEYVGEAPAVSKITDRLQVPQTFERTGIQLQTAQQPYGLTVFYTLPGAALATYQQDAAVFDTGSVVLFSLIQNLDTVTFVLNDTLEFSRTREWANEVMAANVWQASATLDGFQALNQQLPAALASAAAAPVLVAYRPMLQVGDVLYLDTNEGIDAAKIDKTAAGGKILTAVPGSQKPGENGQSNFAAVGAAYVAFGEDLAVFLDEQWILFEKEAVPAATSSPPAA